MDEFIETVWEYYRQNRRDMPWREEPFDPYRILVSEMMLQQTQVARVVPKYLSFLEEFPTVKDLAEAPLDKVLIAWSGLGYNRRARYLHEAAKQLHEKDRWSIEDLVSCKGIGNNTAAAVIVYSYNVPLVFIETNIRTVFIHHFFKNEVNVTDTDILELVKKTLIIEQEEQPETWALPKPGAMRNPLGVSHYREWYWALMDYGGFLKKNIGNASRQSKQYVKQSKFEGSVRQIRGEVLRVLAGNSASLDGLTVSIPDPRLILVLQSLEDEGLISRSKQGYSLSK